MATAAVAAAAASSNTSTSSSSSSPSRDTSWLSPSSEYQVLAPILSITEHATLYKAKQVGSHQLFTVKRYQSVPGPKGALRKRRMEAEREMTAAVQNGVSALI
jgi:hypothetical protein